MSLPNNGTTSQNCKQDKGAQKISTDSKGFPKRDRLTEEDNMKIWVPQTLWFINSGEGLGYAFFVLVYDFTFRFFFCRLPVNTVFHHSNCCVFVAASL